MNNHTKHRCPVCNIRWARMGHRCFICYRANLGTVGIGNYFRPLPKQPTKARPGTAEKVAVMAARAEAEVQLYHPHDATFDEDDDWD